MVYKNLKKIRESKGVRQSYLAEKLNISAMSYSRMESGATKIDVERLKIISSLLDVKIEVFFDNKLTESVAKSRNPNKEAI